MNKGLQPLVLRMTQLFMNLRIRLALIYGLLASIALTLALVVGFGFYQRAAFRNIDGVFQLLTQQSATAYQYEGTLEPPSIGIPVTLRLFDAQGNLLETVGNETAPAITPRETLVSGVPAHAPWVSLLPRVSLNPVSYEGFGLTEQEGVRWRSYTVTLEDDQLLQFVASLQNVDQALGVVRRNFVGLGLLGVLLVLLMGYGLTGPSLRPLTELASSAKELLHAQNITLPTTLRGVTRESLESQQRIPSQDELSFLSTTITSTTTFLSEERERLDLALQAAHMGWWEWDAVTNTHRWSPEFERLLGLNIGEFKGGLEALLARVHPEDRGRVKELTFRTDGSRPAVFEYRVLLPDGNVRWIESRAQTIQGTHGRVTRLLGIDIDVTERKKAQEHLQYAANVLGSVSEAIIATDLEGRIQSWNKGAEDTYGYSLGKVIGRNISDVLVTTFEGETLQSSRAQLLKSGAWRGEVIQHHKDGRPLDILSSVRLQLDGEGKPVGMVAVNRDITAHKRAERELRESEQRYRSLVQASAQLVWSTNEQGFNTEPQQSWLAFTGQTWEEQQDWGWLNAVHEADRERVRASWTRAIETKTPYVERERLRRYDGVYRHMDVRAVPVFEADGSVSEWIGTHTDITERVRSAEALAESEERYRTLVTASNQVVWTLTDKSTGMAHVPWWLDLTGQSPEEARDWGWLEALHPEDRGATRQAWEWALAKLEPYDISYRVLTNDKAIRYLAVRAVPRFDSEGKLVEWIGTINDVTERKRDESRLSEQARTLRNQAELLALANEAIIIRNPDSEISSWNKAASELYGYDEHEALGQTSHELLRTRFISHSKEEVSHALLASGYWEGELQHTRKNGERITVLSRQALRRDDHGNALEVVEINWDITSRKQVEVQREKLLELTQRSEREALALAEIASSFSLAKPFETNLTTIAQRVAQTIGADACAIEIYKDGGSLDLSGAYGYPAGFAEALETLRHQGIDLLAQQAVRQNEVVIAKDYVNTVLKNSDYRVLHDIVKQESWGTVVAVPLPLTQHAGGAVVVFYPKGLDPNLTDLLQLSTIVSQVALVVENAKLFEEAQGKAALEERQRLARDLHDSVSQALYGISLGANSAKNALRLAGNEEKINELERSLDYLIYMADTAMAEMKSLIFELRPESLATEGLVVALRKHLRALELRHRFALSLELPSEPNVSLKVKEMLYRITQEAMNNVIKHAQAKRVWIRLEETVVALELSVRDDGSGFDTMQSFPGHLGLRSMRERAESVGASYEVSSQQGKGTTVRVVIPVGSCVNADANKIHERAVLESV